MTRRDVIKLIGSLPFLPGALSAIKPAKAIPKAIKAEAPILASGIRIELFSGTQPANCSEADSGKRLCSITLSELMPAQRGKLSLRGSGPVERTGIVTHFRLKDKKGRTHIQGTAGESGDFVIDSSRFMVGQYVDILGLSIGGLV